jgi:hypothetical protein
LTTRRVYRERITDRPDRYSDGGTIFAGAG